MTDHNFSVTVERNMKLHYEANSPIPVEVSKTLSSEIVTKSELEEAADNDEADS